MKLRIKGNSLRLRVTRSDVAALLETGRIEETIHFAAEQPASLTYALETSTSVRRAAVLYQPMEVLVALPNEVAAVWAKGEQVGIYESIDIGTHGSLDLIVEKDFACLDVGDDENQDTFPNPNAQALC